MKYCTHCGSEINEFATVCLKCGCAVPEVVVPSKVDAPKKLDDNIADTSKDPRNAIILGILGIIFAWLFALCGHVCSIIGIILGSSAYKKTGKSTGLVLSIIGEVCAVLSSAIGIASVL